MDAQTAQDAPAAKRTRQRQPTWRELRERLNLSIREYADLCGVNRGELSRIERGRSAATPDQARKMLAVLDAEWVPDGLENRQEIVSQGIDKSARPA